MKRGIALLFMAALAAAPVAAQPSIAIEAEAPLAGASAGGLPLSRAERSVPAQLSAREKKQYADIFQAIAAKRLTAARAALAAMPRGLLHPTAEGQLLLAQGRRASQKQLAAWLANNPAAPDASAIRRLALGNGARDLPPLAATRALVPVRLTPPLAPRSALGESPDDRAFATAARALLVNDQPLEVEAMLDTAGTTVSADVQTEWAERAAWNAYISLDDDTAYRLARRAGRGTSEWAAMGQWVAGLAAFRRNDCASAATAFDSIDRIYTASTGLRSAAAYWAARAHVRCGQPWDATIRLKAAMERDPGGFYGLLAAESLGLDPAIDWREPDFIQADWTTLRTYPGARRAVALVEIGETGLADRELRQLAVATASNSYEPILRLAARLDLPATQYWLAQNPPPGMMPPMAARFPTPDWQPLRGWRIEKSLIFAHALQESQFITTARSGAGAKGVMQLMPGTARDVARAIDVDHRDKLLEDPAYNVEYGQSYLEMLRDNPATAGLLPKVIAAYNAGPGAIQKWNDGGLVDNGDVLLFMESIPYLETRHYTETVLRNLWLYELKEEARAGSAAPAHRSRAEVAANRWPRLLSLAATASAGKR